MNDVYLKEVKLLNFQPYKNTTLSFTKGLNVIVAENQVGKTAFMNALKVSVLPDIYDKNDRRDFIRNDAEYAVILYQFSDNSISRVDITLKDNIYYTYDLSSKKFICDGYRPPSSLLVKLGTLVYEGMITNLIDTKQENFLIDTDTKYNNMLLKMLFSHEDLNKIISSVENIQIPVINNTLNESKNKRDVLSILYNRYKYIDIDGLQENVKFSKQLMSLAEGLESVNDKLCNVGAYESKFLGFSKHIQLCNFLNKVVDSINSMHFLSNTNDDMNKYILLIDKLNSLTKDIDSISVSIDTNDLENKIRLIDNLNSIKLSALRNLNNLDSNLFNLGTKLHLIHKKLDEALVHGDIDIEMENMYKDLDKRGGEVYECPVHGKIKLIKGECVPYNK